jgi:hypothetical protein
MSQDSGIDHFSAAIEDCYRYWTFVKLKNLVAEVFANTWHTLHCNTCLSLQFVYNSIIGFISSCIEIARGWCQKSLQPYSNHRTPIYFLWTKTNPSDTLENCNFLLGGDVKMLATLFQPCDPYPFPLDKDKPIWYSRELQSRELQFFARCHECHHYSAPDSGSSHDFLIAPLL